MVNPGYIVTADLMYNSASHEKSQLLTTVCRSLEAEKLLIILEAGKHNRIKIPMYCVKLDICGVDFRD